jgi:glycosyltransferase involved in cell wall biosynthesis
LNVAIIQRLLPPYRVGPLDRVAREITRGGGKVVVIHADHNPAAAAEARHFTAHRVASWQGFGAVWLSDLQRALPQRCDLVIAEFSLRILALPLLLRHCRRRGIPFIWWGSGWEEWGEAGPGFGRALRRRWRARLARRADGMIVYGQQARRFYVNIGVTAEQVWVAPNAIDSNEIRRARESLRRRVPDIEAARVELGLSGKRMLLFMGRLLDYKGVDRLVEAVAASPVADLHLLVIGDGPDRTRLELLAARRAPGRVHFVGAVNEASRKAIYFQAADALVLPAQAGLAVNEALAFGLPVVCGSRRGPELEALEDGVNGLFVEGAGGAPLGVGLTRLYHEPGLLAHLRRGAERTRGHDVETMVRGYLDAISAATRRRPARVLVMGPVPPPIHGVAVMFQTLLDTLQSDPALELRHVLIGDPAKGRDFGRFSLSNVRSALLDLARGGATLLRQRPRVAYLSLSQNRWAFLRDALLILGARALGTRVVAHLHGAHFGEFRRTSSAPARGWIDFVLRRIDRLVVLGEGLRQIVGPALPLYRVRVVANGVDLPPMPSAPDSALSGVLSAAAEGAACRILYMGVLDETKGFRELIHAMSALRARVPAVHLFLAGRWESDLLKRRVEEEIRQRGLDAYVTFLGVVQGGEKRLLLESCDLLALPTFYPLEGLPVVILEAMAAGLPVVATPRGAIPDVVEDGATGSIVPEHDQEFLVTALATLALDPERRSTMGTRAREVHHRRYTAAAFAANLRQVLLDAAAIAPGSVQNSAPALASANLPDAVPALPPITTSTLPRPSPPDRVRSDPGTLLETLS